MISVINSILGAVFEKVANVSFIRAIQNHLFEADRMKLPRDMMAC